MAFCSRISSYCNCRLLFPTFTHTVVRVSSLSICDIVKACVLSWIAHCRLKLKLIISQGLHISTYIISMCQCLCFFSLNQQYSSTYSCTCHSIDYCNALLTDVPLRFLYKLQLVQNSAACVLPLCTFLMFFSNCTGSQ